MIYVVMSKKETEKHHYYVHQCYISLGQGILVRCQWHSVSAEEEDLHQDEGPPEGSSFPQVSLMCWPTGASSTFSKQSAQHNWQPCCSCSYCLWGNFLTTEDELWNFKMYTLLCIWGTFRRHVLRPLLQMVICSSVNWLHLLQMSLQNGLFPHRGAVSLKNRNVSLSGNFTLSLKERIEVFDSAQLSVWSGL